LKKNACYPSTRPPCTENRADANQDAANEAEKLLELAVTKYGDPGGGRVGRRAKGELFELRFLAMAKKAPKSKARAPTAKGSSSATTAARWWYWTLGQLVRGLTEDVSPRAVAREKRQAFRSPAGNQLDLYAAVTKQSLYQAALDLCEKINCPTPWIERW
jgi:hypothetical protein